ncbi:MULTISPECIES: hypothetical protein [Bifidobacterium]|uniref:Gp8 n=2 Tax=Bifidobacterium TaxID=1678 RepID=A0A086ZDV4_9BIFI|nr:MULTISPECIES: hypothetical protein [Bifidobacterium]KFI44704.1 gp8 [Bifidobacterium biavatii DSM 23969]MBW3092649.1 hypothetical protein [Bifidobacterium miconis]
MPYEDMVANPTIDAQWWKTAAQSVIRRYCGWHVCPPTDELLTVDSYGGRTLTLPTKHINSVDSISVDGQDILDQCDWSAAGVIRLRNGYWPDRPRAVAVQLNHGYPPEDVPEILELLRNLAKRARTQPGVASQSVNGASVSYLTAGGAPLGLQLLSIEKDMLEPYRLNWGPQ